MELSEIKMSPKALAKSANKNVMIGFECEVNLNPESFNLDIPTTTQEVDIKKIIDALVNDVDLDLIFIDDDLHDDINDKIEEIVDEDLQVAIGLDFSTSEDYIKYATKHGLYNTDDTTKMENDFKTKSGEYEDIYDHFVQQNTTRLGLRVDSGFVKFIKNIATIDNIQKYYIKHTLRGNISDQEKDMFIDAIANVVDKELYGEWEAVEDGTLGPFGVEIRMTEPLPYQQALEALQHVKDFVKEHGGDTDKKCSLHVNISLPDTDVAQFNYLKALVLFNPTYVNKLFDRQLSIYCKSLLDKINRAKDANHPDIPYILANIKNTISNNKIHTQVSISRLFNLSIAPHKSSAIEVKTNEGADKNRVEFRSIGGDWLDDDNVLTTINRIATIYAACLPGGEELYKKEYLKGVYKIFSPKTNDMLGKTIAAYITDSVSNKTAVDAIQHIAQ